MCDNSRLKEIRNIRLSQNTIPNYIELGLVKSLMRHAFNFKINQKFTPKFIKSRCDNKPNNNNYKIPDFLINLIALHFNIMFRDEHYVEQFLKMFTKVHGLMATKLLVNYQFMDNIINPCCGNAFNSLMTACLWNNNIYMINILYNYGADVSSINSSGLFCEELHSNIPYYNPFGNYLKYHHSCQHNNNHVWGYRLSNNFFDVIQHIRLITGESIRPNFQFPTRILEEDLNRNNVSQQTENNSENNSSDSRSFDIYYNYELINNNIDTTNEDNEEEDLDNISDVQNTNTEAIDMVHEYPDIDNNSAYSTEEEDDYDDEDVVNV